MFPRLSDFFPRGDARIDRIRAPARLSARIEKSPAGHARRARFPDSFPRFSHPPPIEAVRFRSFGSTLFDPPLPPQETLMHTRSTLLRAAAPLLAVLAACTDRGPTGIEPPPAGEGARVQLTCNADVRAGTVSCASGAAGGGAALDLIVGGQGINVRLSNGNTSYNPATQIFSTDVTVQNLLAQQLGSPDGSTVTGVKIFFQTEAQATSGTGDVTLDNADGYAPITSGAPQGYFQYDEILEAYGTSQPRTWRWNVPATVSGFRFTVLVQADLPAEDGPLHWARERGQLAGGNDVNGVWGTSATNVFAVGDRGTILRWTGTRWSGMASPQTAHIGAVWGLNATEVYAVGYGGFVLRYDGNRWETLRARVPAGNEYLFGIWGTSPSDLWAVGLRLDEDSGDRFKLLLHYDGATWQEVPTGTNPAGRYEGVWGTGPNDVYVAGQVYPDAGAPYGAVLHYDGSAWTEVAATGANGTVIAVWGTGSDVFAVGTEPNAGTGLDDGVILRRSGSAWTRTALPRAGRDRLLSSVWGTSATDVYVGAHDRVPDSDVVATTILRWNGAAWSETDVPGTSGANDVWVAPTGEAFAVGQWGGVMRGQGGGWTVDAAATEADAGMLYGVWGAGAEVFAVGAGDEGSGPAVILRSTGSGWSEMSGDARGLRAVSGTSATNVYAAGTALDGTGNDVPRMLRFNGTSWQAQTLTWPGSNFGVAFYGEFTSVWATPGGVAFAAGYAPSTSSGFVFRTTGNGTWSQLPAAPGTDREFLGVWGTSSDVFVVGRGPAGAIVVRYNGAWAETVLPAVAGGDEPAAFAVWGTAADNVYAVGSNGLLARWNGATWSTVPSGTTETLRAVWGTGPADVYVSGDNGVLLHYNGTAWSRVNSGTTATLYAGWGSSATNLYTVGEGNLVLHGTR